MMKTSSIGFDLVNTFVGVAFVASITLMPTSSSSFNEDLEHMALVRPIDVHDASAVFQYSSQQPPTTIANHHRRGNTSATQGLKHRQVYTCCKNDRLKRPSKVNKKNKKKMHTENRKKNMNFGNKVYLDTIN